MTKSEIRMANQVRMTNDEGRAQAVAEPSA